MTSRLTTLAALVALVLAGCGDAKPAADTTPAETAAAEATATPTPIIEKVTGDPDPDAGGHPLGQGRAGDLGAPG